MSETLLDVSDRHSLSLEEPMPRNELYGGIHERFREEGIEIPFPQVSLHAGGGSRAFSVHADMAAERDDRAE